MKRTLTVERGPLVAALAHCRRAITPNKNIPIFSCVFIEQRGNDIIMRATDMDIAIEAPLGRNNGAPIAGAIIMAAAPLAAWLAKTSGRFVTIEDDDGVEKGAIVDPKKRTPGKITTSTDDGKIRAVEYFDSTDALNFAPFDYSGERLVIGWPSAAGTIRRVLAASSPDETRYYLRGVHMHRTDRPGAYRVQATDGHRLYRGTIYARNVIGDDLFPTKDDGGVIIPSDLIKAALATFRQWETVEITLGRKVSTHTPPQKEGEPPPEPVTRTTVGAIRFTDGIVTIYGKLIDGTFPDVDRVIPDIATGHIATRISISAALASLNRLTPGLIKKGRFRAVKLAAARKDRSHAINLTANEQSLYETESELPLDRAYAVPFDLGLNIKYFTESLEFFAPERGAGGDVVMHVKGSESEPVVITGGSIANDDRMAVIMPMRV